MCAIVYYLHALLFDHAPGCRFVLDTVPGFSYDRNPTASNIFYWIDLVTIQIFALDYLIR